MENEWSLICMYRKGYHMAVDSMSHHEERSESRRALCKCVQSVRKGIFENSDAA